MNIKVIVIAAAVATCLPAHAEPTFEAWCDADIGMELVSLAANRIYGPTSGLSDEEYAMRSEWVSEASQRAMARFKARTGAEYYDVSSSLPPDWRQRCQVKSQIQ